MKQLSVWSAFKCGTQYTASYSWLLLQAIVVSFVLFFGALSVVFGVSYLFLDGTMPLLINILEYITLQGSLWVIKDQIMSMLAQAGDIKFFLISSASLLFMFIVTMGTGLGFIKLILRAYDNNNPSVLDLFRGFNWLLFKYVIATGLFFSAIGVGLIFLIIPGIIMATRLIFYMFVLVEDPTISAWNSLQQSWEITQGHTLKLSVVIIPFALVIGILDFFPFATAITGTNFLFMMMCVYRTLNPK